MKALREAICIGALVVLSAQSVVGCGDGEGGDDGRSGGSAGAAGSSAGAGATGGVIGTEGGSGGSGGAAGSPDECAPGQQKCAGECVTLANDPDHCGSCGNACDADEVCSAGECRLDCVGGTTACDRSCVDTELDPENCGACGEVCDVGLVCSRGTCESSCAAGLTWCDGNGDTPARCADTRRDRFNCGECGNVCAAGYVCSNGTCALSCQAGLVNCDGVCIDPKKDLDHCGATTGCSGDAAGEACREGHVCSNGDCRLSCQEGLIQCAGTCVDPRSDIDFCGATAGCGENGGSAGESCSRGRQCVNGECVIVCPPGQIVCAAGCVNPRQDRSYCGATFGCGAMSGSPGQVCDAGEVCSAGTCAVSCQSGLVECNGVCIDPLRDNDYCGATAGCADPGTDCPPGTVCNGGTCSLTCPDGLVKCGDTCVDPMSSREHCGATTGCGEDGQGSAGAVCAAGEVCSSGVCVVSCQEGLVDCGGICINPNTDRNYCGATEGCGVDGQGSAGEVCEPGHVCNDGECSLSCPSNLVNCNGTCIDPQTSPTHCGATEGCGVDGGSDGEACLAGFVCNSGTCQKFCPPGFVNCGGECLDPDTNRAFCGATPGCGADGEGSDGDVCDVGYVCNQGACALSCASGLVVCGGECVDPDMDRTHCGATEGCGQDGQGSAGSVCGPGEVCADGVCSLSCPDGLIRCGDTCINPDTDRSHCGATEGCGLDGGDPGEACDPGYVCNNGTCSLSCQGGLVNCDGVCVDGKSNRSYCGATAGCGANGQGSAGVTCSAGYVCNDGNCSLSCPDPLINCNGVCIDPDTNRTHCGATEGCNVDGQGSAGDTCGPGEVCNAGTCDVSCQTGLIECDGTCIDPDTNRNYCGATAGCGQGGQGTDGEVCPPGTVCQDGTCVISCPAGLIACGTTCIDPTMSREYCGATAGCGENGQGSDGDTCGDGEVCSAGTCALSCQAGLIECNGTCIDPDTNRDYCGATEGCGEGGGTAGTACDAGEICDGGQCVVSCPGALIACDDTCVNPKTDRNHCGATEGCGDGAGSAGQVCDWDQICVDGVCTKSCAAGLVACGGDCIDPDTNHDYCGASGNCQGANAGTACDMDEVCVGGVCTCTGGLVACGGDCVDPDTSHDYCGASGNCQGANAGVACGPDQECVDGECQDLAPQIHENCREFGGLIWCGYGVTQEAGWSCSEICEEAGMSIYDDPSLLNAIDTVLECAALATAFGWDGPVDVWEFQQSCIMISDGEFWCSTDSNCLPYLTTEPGDPLSQYICPCE